MNDDTFDDDSVADATFEAAELTSGDKDELNNAPQASLSGRAETDAAQALVTHLADKYPRHTGEAKTAKGYPQIKRKSGFETAIAAFLAELLQAYGDDIRGGWIRCSLKKAEFTGKPVTQRQFQNVRDTWLAAGLVETVKGYPGKLAFGNPGPSHGRMTRYKATVRLIDLCACHGVTPDNVTAHFHVDYQMPSELVQLTSPFEPTPKNAKANKLREEVAELNAFIAQHPISHPTIRHIGWVRKFHLSNHPDFKWNKGGRLYAQPTARKVNYQSVPEATRLDMRIDGARVAEIDLGSSYLSIFYAWNDQQLDLDDDAYADILGPTKLDRDVAKFWINASFGNSGLIKKWSKNLKQQLENKLVEGPVALPFDPQAYPLKVVREKVLKRHPLLERWGGPIRGRVRDYGDLMFAESEIIIGSMQALMREHGVPSLPVHDSLIVPRTKVKLAMNVLTEQYRRTTGMLPRLDVSDPWDF
ncbi:hypothetical protein [Tardiphaga sp. 813_E8_N1_3]|uniref:hypothetical protein n=1 Tax=Tardiphaga sp. 813_E8_N1_3 TaxID=3240760 RepID=UPI003F29780A